MDIQKNSFLSIDQLANQYLNNSRKTVKAAQENLVSFQEILQNKSQEQNVSGTQQSEIFQACYGAAGRQRH